MDQPIFYTQNYARLEANVITVSSGDTNKIRLWDRNKETQWSSIGSNDATQENIIIDFGVVKTIGAVFLDNVNLKGFKIQYWDGSAFQDLAGAGETVYALSSWYKEFTAVSTQKIKIVMDTTQTANQQKKIGEVYLCDKVYTLPDTEGFDYKPDTLEIGGSYRLGNGNQETYHVVTKWLGKYIFEALSPAILAYIKAIYDTHNSFCFYPEPVDSPSEFYEVNWNGKFTAQYFNEIKANGKNLNMDLEEV